MSKFPWMTYMQTSPDGAAAGNAAPAPKIDPAAGSNGAAPPAGANGDGAAAPAGGEVKPIWQENWRETYAGADEKKLGRVSRYATPAAAFDALLSLQNRLSAGELRSNLPEKPTPEQLTQWRTENGIPEAPEKYDLTKLKDGTVIGEQDKHVIDAFLKSAHGANYTPTQAKAAVEWYFDTVQQQHEQRAAQDAEVKRAGEDQLRAEWGGEFRRNINDMNALLDAAPTGVKDMILGSRDPSGNPLGSNPEVLRWLTSLSREINPVSTLVPNAGANIAGAIEDEIGKLEGMMPNRSSEYWKGPNAEKNQARLRELYAARDKHKGGDK